MAILNHYNIPLEGKHVVVVGKSRSQVISKPVALMALAAAHGTHYNVHSRTSDHN